MTSLAVIATGVSLEVGDGASPEVFTAIAEVVDIDGPKLSAKQIDVSSLQSTFREYIGGLPDGGEVTLSLNFLSGNTNQQTLQSDVTTGMKRNYKVVLNDTPTGTGTHSPTNFAFAALVIDWALSAKTGDKLSAAVTLKTTGPVVTTWAS